jgi:hypothetical protein
MDIVLVLSSLVGLGIYLNRDHNNNNNRAVRATVPVGDVPNSYNVYESNAVPRVRAEEQAMGDALYRRSKTPEKTGVIPPLFNTYTEEDKKKGLLTQSSEPEAQVMTSRSLQQKQGKLTQGGPSLVVADVDYIENDSSFTHQNQVPFFRGSQPKQNTIDNAHTSRLERFTGTGEMYRSKQETSSFYEGAKNENVFVSKSLPEDTIQRYSDQASKIHSNVPLQDPIRVPENTKFVRTATKTVDDLRVSSKPKLDMSITEDHILGYSSININSPVVPDFVQNRTPRESELGDGLIPHAKSLVVGRTTDLDVIVPTNARSVTHGDNTGYFGTAIKTIKNYITKDNYSANTTARDTTNSSYSGVVGTGLAAREQQLNMTPERTTIKQTTLTDRTGGAGAGIETVPTSRVSNYAAEINALKALTIQNRDPNEQGQKISSGLETVKLTDNSTRGVDDLSGIRNDLDRLSGSNNYTPVEETRRRRMGGVSERDNEARMVLSQLQDNPYSLK